MKGNEILINVLNELLIDELTAISQYMVQSEMCDNWGYKKLHEALEKQAIDEMHHAEWLIQRIIFLEGMPVVNKLNEMKIGKSVKEFLNNNRSSEDGAVKAYNQGISLARKVEDESTAELLTKILKMEEDHIDWTDIQIDQINQMGLENYLANQV